MINFNKKDPVADAIRDIMEKELSTAQKKIAALAGDKKTIDALDLAALRAGKKPTSEEAVEENAFDYKSPRKPEPNGGSGVKQGSRYGGSKQKEKPEQEEPKEKMKEEIDPSDRTKDTLAGRTKTKQKDDVGPGSDSKSTKVRYHPGPMTLKGMKEKYEEPIIDELINEVLSKNADAGDWIHDFVHSDNPKFAGKSKAERKKMALGAYYAKKNEEYVEEGMLKNVAKKAFKALTGGSDEDQRKDLQRKMGVPQTGKKPEPQKEEVEQIDELSLDTLKSAERKNAQAASDYHMDDNKHWARKSAVRALSLQKRIKKKEKQTSNEEVVMEGRTPVSSPGMDTPFVTDAENKPLGNAKELAAKTMKRMKNEMLGKTGTSE